MESEDMEFPSYRSYANFSGTVRRQWRYVFHEDVTTFLATLLFTSRERVETIPKASVLWRAQLGNDCYPEDVGGGQIEEMPCPFPPQRMKPLLDRAREGRANPKGIPYLYLATHDKTAVSEVRPWVGVYVSLAQLRTTRELRILNCTTEDNSLVIYFSEPSADERERAVWRDVDLAFAEPVTRTDDYGEYVPTQIIAEFFRKQGFDGLAYRSSLGPGHNVVLFDLAGADVINCSLVEIKAVDLRFDQVANPYFTS